MVAGFAAGLVPIPLVDLAIMSAVQVNLVRRIASAYDERVVDVTPTGMPAEDPLKERKTDRIEASPQ